jgi:hypothetical protein
MTKLPDQVPQQAPEEHSLLLASQIALGQSAIEGVGTETYLDMPLEDVTVYMHGDVGKSPMGEEDATEELRNEWLQQREAILALPSNAEGLNLDRVDAYRRKMGGRDVALRFLSPDNFRRSLDIARDKQDGHVTGHYSQEADVIAVIRDTSEGSLETLNGPELTESFAVHELDHAANEHQHTKIDVTIEKRRLRKPVTYTTAQKRRMGSIVRTGAVEEIYEGSGIEEAQAEFERGKYVVEVLNRPQGFTDDGIVPGKPSPLDKYSFKMQKPDGTVVNKSTQYAVEAVILELMVDCEPKLLDALRASKHSVEGLRERARIMNSILPGAYQRMRKVDVQSDDPIAQKQRAATSRQLLVEVLEAIKLRKSK